MSLAIRLQLLSGKYALLGRRMLSFAWALGQRVPPGTGTGCDAGLAGNHNIFSRRPANALDRPPGRFFLDRLNERKRVYLDRRFFLLFRAYKRSLGITSS